jgi:hypothetical protein
MARSAEGRRAVKKAVASFESCRFHFDEDTDEDTDEETALDESLRVATDAVTLNETGLDTTP